jgi:hypothetical protein
MTVILVVSGNSDIREGWARHFEARGHSVMRCAGPEATHCALELGPHCPLQEDADVAYYDNACLTVALAASLTKRPRRLRVFFADDRVTAGRHEPEVTLEI